MNVYLFSYIAMSFSRSFLWARMKNVTTRWMKFLGEMDQILPWEKLVREIDQRRNKQTTGRPRYSTEIMLRIYFLQQRYDLWDPTVEDAIYDRVSFQKFLDIDITQVDIPDETTILNFRHFLLEHKLQKRIFKHMNNILEEKWLLMKEWTTVDATIIHASGSTKNKDKSRDPEMWHTMKNNNHYFGMKVHTGTTSDKGLIHTIKCTPANKHDLTQLEELLHWEEKVIRGDSAYMSKQMTEKFRKKGVAYYANRRWNRWRKLDQLDKWMNHVLSKTRARGERAYGVIKNLWKHRRTRYRWIEKNEMQRYVLAGLSNMYMMRKQLLS